MTVSTITQDRLDQIFEHVQNSNALNVRDRMLLTEELQMSAQHATRILDIFELDKTQEDSISQETIVSLGVALQIYGIQGTNELETRIFDILEEDNSTASINSFGGFMKNIPESDYIPRIINILRDNKTEQAAIILDEFLEEHPESSYAIDASKALQDISPDFNAFREVRNAALQGNIAGALFIAVNLKESFDEQVDTPRLDQEVRVILSTILDRKFIENEIASAQVSPASINQLQEGLDRMAQSEAHFLPGDNQIQLANVFRDKVKAYSDIIALEAAGEEILATGPDTPATS